MGKDFWLNRWKNNEIGWHQNMVEPALVRWANQRVIETTFKKPIRILVPLCGKTLDMVWLRDHGFQVVGVELSTVACETFFVENKIKFTKSIHGEYVFYQGEGIVIINGDFFSLTPELLGGFDAIYDRAALIALPPPLRVRYTQKLISILPESIRQKDFEVLQVILTRTPEDEEGPPYSVSPEEVEKLYGDYFKIEVLGRNPVEARGPIESLKEECVLLLKPKN